MFNILIGSFSLNTFSSLPQYLCQIIERTNVLTKRHNILGFFKFSRVFQISFELQIIVQYYFIIFSYLLGEFDLV